MIPFNRQYYIATFLNVVGHEVYSAETEHSEIKSDSVLDIVPHNYVGMVEREKE